jgi:hypothetical protein
VEASYEGRRQREDEDPGGIALGLETPTTLGKRIVSKIVSKIRSKHQPWRRR